MTANFDNGLTDDKLSLVAMDVHELDGGVVRRFDASFEIAESWRRLAFDPEHIQPHDRTLLQHELMEMRLVNEGLNQDEAHTITSRKYNYSQESSDYYLSLNIEVNRDDPAISGGITYLGGNTH